MTGAARDAFAAGMFVADSSGHSAIEAIETDGTGRRELVARSEGRIGTVLIGPGGDRLVFMRDSVPYRYDLPDGPPQRLEVEADATPEDWTPGAASSGRCPTPESVGRQILRVVHDGE